MAGGEMGWCFWRDLERWVDGHHHLAPPTSPTLFTDIYNEVVNVYGVGGAIGEAWEWREVGDRFL